MQMLGIITNNSTNNLISVATQFLSLCLCFRAMADDVQNLSVCWGRQWQRESTSLIDWTL